MFAIATAVDPRPLDERLPRVRKRSRLLPILFLLGPAAMNFHLLRCLTLYAEWFQPDRPMPASATVTTLVFAASPIILAASILWLILGIVILRIKGRLSLLEPAYWLFFGSVGMQFCIIAWAL